ncbi:MAG: hypothetical protein K8R53_06195 [Bacteroidales bacterium]|nr:hypothetical protein [Bacteroidales bacterium]
MKKLIIFSLLVTLFLVPKQAFSQKGLELSGYTGWMLGGKVNLYDGSLKIDDGQNWGITLSLPVAPGIKAELMYNRLVSNLIVREYGNVPYVYTKVATQYFHVGAVRELVSEGMVRPYGTGTMGVAIFSDREGFDSDRWRFSVGLGGGLKIFPTELVGFRLQARMLVPMYFNGIWLGTGGGGVSASSSIIQGDFTGGLILAF